MPSIWITWNDMHRISSNKDIVLFGAGHQVKHTINNLDKKPLYIVDNNKSKHGSEFFGIKIASPDILKKGNRFLILITTPHYDNVAQQLENIGFIKGIDFFCSPAMNNLKIASELKNHKSIIYFTSGDTPDREGPFGGGLYQYDIYNRTLTKLINGKFHEIIYHNDYFYVIDELVGIKVINRNHEVINTYNILPGSVPHGITIDSQSGLLYVANTLLDSISVIEAKTGVHVDEFNISKNLRHLQLDRHHINDLSFYQGNLYVSMFSFSGLWESGCYDGGIAQIDINSYKITSHLFSGLWMPHSICFINNEIFAADSMRGTIYKTTNKKLYEMNGFARGIAYDNYYYYFGQSEHRYFDRLKDVSHNIQLNAGIHVFDETNKASIFHSFENIKNIHSIYTEERQY